MHVRINVKNHNVTNYKRLSLPKRVVNDAIIKTGSAISNEREPKSCLDWVFISKLGSIVIRHWKCTVYILQLYVYTTISMRGIGIYSADSKTKAQKNKNKQTQEAECGRNTLGIIGSWTVFTVFERFSLFSIYANS